MRDETKDRTRADNEEDFCFGLDGFLLGTFACFGLYCFVSFPV